MMTAADLTKHWHIRLGHIVSRSGRAFLSR